MQSGQRRWEAHSVVMKRQSTAGGDDEAARLAGKNFFQRREPVAKPTKPVKKVGRPSKQVNAPIEEIK